MQGHDAHLLRRGVIALAAALATGAPMAQQATEASATVVVSATRSEAAAFDVPASISRIDGDALRAGRAQVNLSEGLGAVPGLLARDRQNYAQDVQISVRGFGARSSFGIRGVRLYVDGIPATLPDGQGQITNVELGSVGRIEVLRGPFSALYGNSSGGVISVFSEAPSDTPRVGFSFGAGSDGLQRLGINASGRSGGFGYTLGASLFQTDGYRDHSQTERRLGNVKLAWQAGATTQITLVANSVALPEAQDPLGLSRAQWQANPRGVDPSAISFDTRKTMNQTQGGLIVEQRLDAANDLRLLAYQGHRGTEQFQSIPVATQANALHPGGVIALGRDYRGVDARWRWKTRLADAPFTLVAGLAWDDLDEQRVGYQNFIGTQLGVEGALRRNENNRVTNSDQYLQASWQPLPAWTLNAGLRHSQVRFRSSDAYITATNPNDSGSADYGATLPVLGLLWALDERVHIYATAGRGFETPTLNELAYRPGGGTGLNFSLQAARSHSVEAGVKARPAGWGEMSLALFQTGTEHEIVTQTNVGGRATFQNAGATRRRGMELGWQLALAGDLRAELAATVLDARYRDAFVTCTATPCASANQRVAADNRIPGIAKNALYAGLAWQPASGWRGGLELRSLSKVWVNDLNNDAAPAYTVMAAHIGYQLNLGAWEVGTLLRVDNLSDRRYAGSVIVNDGNGRFFEPAPGRSWLASASATLRF